MMDLTAYLDHIRANYGAWWALDSTDDPVKVRIRQEMKEDFDSSLSYDVGSKYIKVCTGREGRGRSVHSFICLKDDGKFKVGDILKAASWAAPARNFARGNILRGEFQNITWTGA